MTWLPRTLGALTAVYGAATLVRPSIFSQPAGLSGDTPPTPVGILVRAVGVRDIANGLAMAAAPTGPALRLAIGARIAADLGDAATFALSANEDAAAKRKAIAVGVGVELLVENLGVPMHGLDHRESEDVGVHGYARLRRLRPQHSRRRVGNLDAGHSGSVCVSDRPRRGHRPEARRKHRAPPSGGPGQKGVGCHPRRQYQPADWLPPAMPVAVAGQGASGVSTPTWYATGPGISW
jgi:hypothetical protein